MSRIFPRNHEVFGLGRDPFPAYMDHAEYKAHDGTRPVGRCIACKAIALEISLKTIQVSLGLYHIPGPGAVVVKECDQPFHDRPAHPKIFPFGRMLVVVYHGDGGLVGLDIMAAEHLGDKHVVERFEKLHRPLVPQLTMVASFRPIMPRCAICFIWR